VIPIGSLDRVTAIVGERGMGKSTLARLDARDFQRSTGGYVIGHSPNGQIGAGDNIAFHDDLRKLQRGLRRHPEKMHFLAAGPAEPILHFGDALSIAIRRSAHRREWKRFKETRPAPEGLEAPPLLIVIDEGTSMKRHPSNEETEALERLLVNARHKHLAITWSIQAPTARQWVLMEQANRLRIFRYTHEYGVNSLRAGGIPKDVAYQLRELPRFHYFAMDKGGDDEGNYRRLPDP
jgi:hypothetical protein